MVDQRCMKMMRPLLPAFVGMCLGIAMTMMYAPFSDSSCETYVARQDPQQLVHMRGTKSLANQEESFDPVIRPPLSQGGDSAGKSDNTPAGKAKFVRPRYASTELDIREKLFVGVVTSKNTINTLGVAVNKTISNYVTKLMYFMDDKGPVVPSGMTIINFADNHPHLVPVHMLKYVTEHYSDTFDYYMFLTDRTYMRGERTFDLVSHISVSQHVHMGLVKSTEAGKTYCHLEGGIIVSQSLIEQVKANLEWCLAKCHHNDQSLNFGKCLVHVTDVACTDHGGVKKFTVHEAKSFDFSNIQKMAMMPEFNQSYTVFPMPDDTNLYKLHRYFCEHELNTTRQEINKLKETVLYMSQFAPGGRDSISWPIGVPESYKPKNRFDVIRWDYFTETLIYFEDDFNNVKPLKGADKLDVQEVVKLAVEQLNTRNHNRYLYNSLVNGYRRFDPQRGMEYIVDITLRDTVSNSQLVQKRVQLVRPLGQVEIVNMPYVTETTLIHLVLAVGEEDKEGVGTFLDAYAHTCLDTQENTALLIIFVYRYIPKAGQEDTFSVLKSMIAYYNKKYTESGTSIEWVALQSNGSFVSEFHLMDVVVPKFPPDSLMLFCSVGMELTTDLFNRVRMNTIAEWQVFYPIGFWQYKPNLIYDKKPYPTTIELINKVGHYDMLSYEHFSFYISDYLRARQMMLQDDLLKCDIFEMFVKYSNLHVLRAVEPALKHRYKQFNCQASWPPSHYQRCMERRLQGLGTRAQLAKLIFQHQENTGSAGARDTV